MLCYIMLYYIFCYAYICYIMLCCVIYVILFYVLYYVTLRYVLLCYVLLCCILCYVIYICYIMLCCDIYVILLLYYTTIGYVMLRFCYVMIWYDMLYYDMICYDMLCYIFGWVGVMWNNTTNRYVTHHNVKRMAALFSLDPLLSENISPSRLVLMMWYTTPWAWTSKWARPLRWLALLEGGSRVLPSCCCGSTTPHPAAWSSTDGTSGLSTWPGTVSRYNKCTLRLDIILSHTYQHNQYLIMPGTIFLDFLGII